MGNELTRSHQPYLVRQISESSGKDEATIEGFYSTFEKECPSGVMTPEDFSTLYSKVMCCVFDICMFMVDLSKYGSGRMYTLLHVYHMVCIHYLIIHVYHMIGKGNDSNPDGCIF